MTDYPFFAPYGEEFWTENGSVTHRQSERSIAGHLHTMLKPESVVDVGCGTGQMLQMFKERGARVLGFESSNGVEWTQRLHIQECGQFIQAVDLRDHEAIPVVKDVDLVVCVEVAEHLPEQAARGMVYDICHRLNPRWLAFSGAVPRSPGGTGHINEQYFPYWKSLVESFGTHVLDRDRSNALHRFLSGCQPMFTWASNIYLYRRVL